MTKLGHRHAHLHSLCSWRLVRVEESPRLSVLTDLNVWILSKPSIFEMEVAQILIVGRLPRLGGFGGFVRHDCNLVWVIGLNSKHHN